MSSRLLGIFVRPHSPLSSPLALCPHTYALRIGIGVTIEWRVPAKTTTRHNLVALMQTCVTYADSVSVSFLISDHQFLAHCSLHESCEVRCALRVY